MGEVAHQMQCKRCWWEWASTAGGSHTLAVSFSPFMKGALSSSFTTADTCADEGVFSSTSTLTDGAWASFLFLIPASSRLLVVVVGHQDEPAAARLSLSTPISGSFRTSFYIYALHLNFLAPIISAKVSTYVQY